MIPAEQILQLNTVAQDREGLIIADMSKAQEGRRGCTDPLAGNYDPLATEDDGQCYYEANSQSSG